MRPKSKYYDLMFLPHEPGAKVYATKEYSAYWGIVSRVKSRSKYTALGISPEFLGPEGFKAFFDEIGPALSPQHTVDRIDNTRGYFIGNIRWATYSEQLRNTSRTFMVLRSDNSQYSMREFCEIYNLNPQAVRQRYAYYKVKVIDENVLIQKYVKGVVK